MTMKPRTLTRTRPSRFFSIGLKKILTWLWGELEEGRPWARSRCLLRRSSKGRWDRKWSTRSLNTKTWSRSQKTSKRKANIQTVRITMFISTIETVTITLAASKIIFPLNCKEHVGKYESSKRWYEHKSSHDASKKNANTQEDGMHTQKVEKVWTEKL